MEVSTITLEHGVYHFHCQQKVYLPRARDDIGAVRNSIRALLSVKVLLCYFIAQEFSWLCETIGCLTNHQWITELVWCIQVSSTIWRGRHENTTRQSKTAEENAYLADTTRSVQRPQGAVANLVEQWITRRARLLTFHLLILQECRVGRRASGENPSQTSGTNQ